jgi:hypothetical protein
VLPVMGPASQERVPDSGASSTGSSERSTRLMRSLRMSQCFALADWKRSSGNLLRSGMTRSGTVYPLPPLAPLTVATECGLLPTPSATAYGTTNNGHRTDGTYKQAGKPSLNTMARHGLWPTPTAGCCEFLNSSHPPQSAAHPGISLTDAVRGDRGTGRLWPTPSATDGKGSVSLARALERQGQSSRGVRLPEHIALTENREVAGTLNPTFVEFLMGFPLGHTVLEPSEIPSSPRSRNSSGRKSCAMKGLDDG